MTPDIILDIDHDRVRLLRREAVGEAEVGCVAIDRPDLEGALSSLRAGLGASGPVAALVRIPSALVMFLDAAGLTPQALKARVEAATGCPAEDLVVSRAGDLAAAVERTTLEEARSFARTHGFDPQGYLVRRTGAAAVEVGFELTALPPPPFLTRRGATSAEAAASGMLPAPERRAPPPTPMGERPARVGSETASSGRFPGAPGSAARETRRGGRLVAPLPVAAALGAAAVLAASVWLIGPAPQGATPSSADEPVIDLTEDITSLDPVVEATADLAPAAEAPAPAAPSTPPPETESAPQIASRVEVDETPASALTTPVSVPKALSAGEPVALNALVPPSAPETAPPLAAFTPPPPPGSIFEMDERGFVRPSEDGALTPKGVPVFAGAPSPRPPPEVLGSAERQAQPDAQAPADPVTPPEAGAERAPPDAADVQQDAALPAPSVQPQVDAVLPAFRPRSRPDRARATVTAATADADTPRPRGRPDEAGPAMLAARSEAAQGFDALGREARAQSAAAGAGIAAAAPRAAAPPPPEPEVRPGRSVSPRLPTQAAVAEQATVANAIALDRVNLIGVYGAASDRRALVRLPTGRYVKLKVGDRIDGGRVAAIRDDRVEYVRGGRRYALTLPNG